MRKSKIRVLCSFLDYYTDIRENDLIFILFIACK